MLQIRQSSQAWHDIVDISLFIAKDNLVASDSFAEIVAAKLRLLAAHPEIGQRRPDLGSDVRCLAAGSYLLVYRVAVDAVELMRVIHAARDIDTLF